jgi:DNA-binding SARP family transcriptional activator
MAMDMQMEFGVLGPLLVRRGAVPLPIPPGKQRALLAALLLAANQVVSQDALIDTLWGADPPPSAVVSLQNHVKRLRRSLADFGRDRIRTERRGYLIRVLAGELDMREFEELARAGRVAACASDWGTAADRLGEAVSLWRGEPLAGVCADVLAQREVPRLAELRLQALEGWIDADLHLGRHGEVIAELRRLVAANPLRERLVQLLMTALHRDGQRAEALATYHAARRTLLDELGMEPGVELNELHRQLLTGEPAMAAGAAVGDGRGCRRPDSFRRHRCTLPAGPGRLTAWRCGGHARASSSYRQA